MKSKTFPRLTCLAVLLLCTQSIHAYAQSNQAPNNQKALSMEHDEIHATINMNNSAVGAGDMEEVLATFEPNGVLVGQPGMPAMGTPALREAFAQFMAINPKITVTNHDVIQTGDIALHSSTWTMSGKTPDGSLIEQNGFSVVVLRKQPDGRWLMVIDNPFGDHLVHKK
ncbi:YybH family protein [Kiloniella antarctica]|uniref:YybH family protein n=1 Tax=Kiloniella antarctica TaxID=1550907 RepID=A0ABW5BI82_9PROT